jgi:DNA-binding NarL/FixJ family response regulator
MPDGKAGSPVRLVLADDHEDVLRELRVLLHTEFVVVASVTDGFALIAAARQWKPDVVISDIKMPGLSGLEACRQIVEQGHCSASIIVTMHHERQLVKDALRAGIRGYVLKIDAGEELVSAVRSVLGGSVYLSRGVLRNWTDLG